MGNVCDQYPLPEPDTLNHCNDYSSGESDYVTMPNLCTNVDFNLYITEWCEQLGSVGEWEGNGTDLNQFCLYNACNPYQEAPRGCCKGCCGIAGRRPRCYRTAFNGNPLKCCFQDKVCANPIPGSPQAPDACFSDPTKKDTCAPCHRDIASSASSKPDGSQYSCGEKNLTPCQDIAFDYCSGADGDPNWIDRWYNTSTGEVTPQSCEYALKRSLFNISTGYSCNASKVPFTNSTGTCTPINLPMSAEGVQWSRELINAVLVQYARDGYVLGAQPGSPQYNPFQDYLYQLFCAVPVVAQDGLKSSCSIYNADRLSRSPTIAGFCGCYLPDSEYQPYVDGYQVNKECTPMCNRLTSIPIISADNQPYRCTQTSCIIDNISINLINSSVGSDGVGISQVCGNCGTNSSCTCVVSNNSITAVNAGIGGIDITTQCSSSTCSVPNPDPTGSPPTILVPCDKIDDPNSIIQQELDRLAAEKRNEDLIKIGLFIGLIAILIIGVIISGRRK
jgi:hypothetical protein